MKWIKYGFMLMLSLVIMFFGHTILELSATENEDGVDGQFNSQGFNNDADIEAVRLFQVIGSTSTAINAGESLQPQNTYRFEIDVFDFDSVNDIETLEIRLFYVASGSGLGLNDAFEATTTTSDDGSTLVLRFTNDKDEGGSFALITNAAVSWELMNTTVPAVNVTDQAFTFEVEFKISKVATFSTDAEWHLGLLVTDGFLAEGADLRTVTYASISLGNDPLVGASTFNMNWYGEISVPDETSVSWPLLLPGSDFDAVNNNATLPAITYISNGGYAREVNSTATWVATQAGITNAPNANLNLVTSAAVEDFAPQTFGLRINEADENYDTDLGNAITILDGFSETGIQTEGTNEAGVLVRYEVFIALSRNFQNATYEGRLTFLITNLLEVGS